MARLAGVVPHRPSFPDGHCLAYEYDPAARLTGIRENGGAWVASFTHDGLGRRQGSSVGGASTAYGYDAISRLARQYGPQVGGCGR